MLWKRKPVFGSGTWLFIILNEGNTLIHPGMFTFLISIQSLRSKSFIIIRFFIHRIFYCYGQLPQDYI